MFKIKAQFPVHQVWSKRSWKAQWKGEEDKADKGRGGKTSGIAKSQRAVENREKWRKLVAKSSVVPKRPSQLRDKWKMNWGGGVQRKGVLSVPWACHGMQTTVHQKKTSTTCETVSLTALWPPSFPRHGSPVMSYFKITSKPLHWSNKHVDCN